jgi:hypothetical protein
VPGFHKAALRVRKYILNLPASYARKPIHNIMDAGTRFEIFEQDPHGNSRTAKNPCPAHFIGVALQALT